MGEFSGKMTSVRVLANENGVPATESSGQGSGTLYGVPVSGYYTYTSVLRPDGNLQGQGQGILMTEDGEGATWQGSGVGRFTGQGAGISFRGALLHQTASEKLARLNDVAAIFEWEIAADGETTTGTFWEWK